MNSLLIVLSIMKQFNMPIPAIEHYSQLEYANIVIEQKQLDCAYYSFADNEVIIVCNNGKQLFVVN